MDNLCILLLFIAKKMEVVVETLSIVRWVAKESVTGGAWPFFLSVLGDVFSLEVRANEVTDSTVIRMGGRAFFCMYNALNLFSTSKNFF